MYKEKTLSSELYSWLYDSKFSGILNKISKTSVVYRTGFAVMLLGSHVTVHQLNNEVFDKVGGEKIKLKYFAVYYI